MTTDVRDTSIEAYRDVKERGVTARQHGKIYSLFLFNYPTVELTRNEIAMATGLALSAVCGRVNEMIKAGVLQDGPRRACRISGKNCHVVSIKATAEGHVLD